MNELTLTEHKSQSLTLWIVYCSYLLTIPAIIGALVNWFEIRKTERIKNESSAEYDTTLKIIDSHHRWLLRTFIFCFVFSLAAVGTSYYGVGFVVGIVTFSWWYYRVIKGMIMLSANKAMPS
jgi:uncharacterized membrane protein